MRLRRYLPLAAVTLLAASCGSSSNSSQSASTSGSTDSTIPATSTTTTTSPENVSPLDGLPYSNSSDANLPALLVKIDNAPPAWPQSGILHSDVVYEEMVEGGYTRYMLVFQSKSTGELGPIRSVRASDADIASPLRGLFAYSGGIPTFVSDIRKSGVKDVGANILGGAYYRLGSRLAPHNLYSSTETLYSDAAKANIQAPVPPKLFDFRKQGSSFDASGAQSVNGLNVDISGNALDKWTWVSSSGVWTRSTNGTQQVNVAGKPEDATNVIVEFVNYSNTGFIDPAGNPVPQAHSVGSGTALFLSGGKEATGTWSKSSESSVTTFADSSGNPVKLAPGRTWVEFAPIGTKTSSF